MTAMGTWRDFLRAGREPIKGKWAEWVKWVAGNEEKRKKGYVDLPQEGEDEDEREMALAGVGQDGYAGMEMNVDMNQREKSYLDKYHDDYHGVKVYKASGGIGADAETGQDRSDEGDDMTDRGYGASKPKSPALGGLHTELVYRMRVE